MGTSAPGTALASGNSIQIAGAEHFSRQVHSWSCTAVPLRDPETGSVLGVVDITGRDHAVAEHALALVEATVAAAQAQLRVERLQQADSAGRRPAGIPPLRPARRRRALPAETPDSLQILGRDSAVVTVGGRSAALSIRHSELLTLLALQSCSPSSHCTLKGSPPTNSPSWCIPKARRSAPSAPRCSGCGTCSPSTARAGRSRPWCRSPAPTGCRTDWPSMPGRCSATWSAGHTGRPWTCTAEPCCPAPKPRPSPPCATKSAPCCGKRCCRTPAPPSCWRTCPWRRPGTTSRPGPWPCGCCRCAHPGGRPWWPGWSGWRRSWARLRPGCGRPVDGPGAGGLRRAGAREPMQPWCNVRFRNLGTSDTDVVTAKEQI
ncbi:GAF domain-containing protein [Arthrobacter sp. ATA002]|uniref:GAF domain-containing protein n=1 Tax=Arthrobacter sp. ATA002 TaxID=2991715 RepID=UPI002E31D207|nr:GAF domain-containing protein [Arthrobacter sp. ATA002]